MNVRCGLSLIILAVLSTFTAAQNQESFSYFGDARFAYTSGSDDPASHFDGTSYLRVRIGADYSLNENNSFRARIATTQSSNLDPVYVQITPDNAGINYGGITFDELYYRFKNEQSELKIGRFQFSAPVKSNAGRSIYKFQSNHINIHWTDGIYFKRFLNEEWFGEFVGEYQHRNNLSYSYRNNLNFGNNEHNAAAYLGMENQTRDDFNFIQKGFGLFYAPDAYLTPDGYSYYLGIMSRIVYDLPQPDALHGGSFRIAGEAGQNLNTSFENGTILNLSFGIHNFADKHQLMIEFTKMDAEWQTANVYAPNADEVEIRYRYFFSSQLNIDFRYRIREPRSDLVPTNYNFFARASYSF